MGIIKRIIEGKKLLAQTAGIPFVRISTDRTSAETLYDKGFSPLALGIFSNTRRAAHEKGLLFDELICILREIEIRTDDDSEMKQALYARLDEIENILDDDEAVSMMSHAYSYDADSVDAGLTPVLDNIIRGSYDWFLYESQKASANLHYSVSVICAKAACRLCEVFDSLSYEQEADTLFSLGLVYGNIRSSGKAIAYYDKAISLARNHHDRATEFVAIVRKLSILLVISHIDTYLDYDKERDATLKDLLDLVGDRSFNAFYARLIADEETRMAGQPGERGRIAGHIDRIEEAVPNLELLLALRYGDMDEAGKCVQRVKAAEIKLYGNSSQAESLIEYYQMLFNPPERDAMEADAAETEDPLLVPDLPENMLLSSRFGELLKWTTNCTVNNWHESAENSAAILFAAAVESGSDYHICLARYMFARELAHAGRTDEALEGYEGTLSILNLCRDEAGSDAGLSPYLYYAIHMSIGDLKTESAPAEAVLHFDQALAYLDQENSSHLFLETYIRTSRASALEKSGSIAEAEQEFVSILQKLAASAIERLPYLTGDERETVWSEILRAIKRVIARLNGGSSDSLRTAAYNALLFSKGFLLTTEQSIQSIVSASGYGQALDLYHLSIQDNSITGTWGTPHTFTAEQYVDKYLNDVRLQLLIKDALSDHSVKPREDFDSIRTSLRQGEALVDFHDIQVDSPGGGNKYLAFIVKPESGVPLVVETCSESALTSVFARFAEKGLAESALYDPGMPYGQMLIDLVWKPLIPYLDECETIYFSPSGSLHRIAVECLPTEAGPVSERYKAFHRISHPREVSAFRQESVSGIDRAVLIGGLEYDDSADGGPQPGGHAESRGYASNGLQADDAPVRWPFLPWSEREVDAVHRIWQLKKPSVSSLHKGQSGDTGFFRSLSDGGPGLLHIATHGFSMTRSAAQSIPALKGLHLPLDLTGLILSGGNAGWLNGDKTGHRGVITATEIAAMDLAHTRLVVLSACFTGGGFIGQDGLYGLIRAFKKAGAKTILASLWEADDEASYYFMYNFYAAFLVRELDYRDAFEYARTCTREAYPDPACWAGYVLVD